MQVQDFALVSIALVRLVGTFVLTVYTLKKRGYIYLWLTVAWLIYTLSPVCGLLFNLTGQPAFQFLYLSLALEGMLMLAGGALALMRSHPLRFVMLAGGVLMGVMLWFFLAGRGSLLGVLVPAAQFLILAVATTISLVNRRIFLQTGGDSLYWLAAIFAVGSIQALAFVFFSPQTISELVYVVTLIMSVLIIIFFMHLEVSLTASRERESELRYRLIVENQSDLIIKLDMDGRFLYANPRYCALFGVSPEQLLGTVIKRPSDGRDENGAPRQARLALYREPYTCYVEELTPTAAGPRWLAWSEKTVFDENQRMMAVVAAGRDITEQKEAELEILRLNQELEQRVEQRTSELKKLNHELESFTYSVSHDLKAPLRGIEGFSQILLEEHGENLDPDGRHYLETIHRIVTQMREMIDALLAYSRVERRAVHRQPVSLDDLVRELLAEHRPELEASGALVQVSLQGCVIQADREHLRAALGNLLDNAIKYSSKSNPPRIEVGYICVQPRVHIWVKDNGIGFDMAHREKIFELFQRLHGQGEYSGTGVGLSIVAKAVQRMEGSIDTLSAPGQGATFTLDLPA